MNKEIRIDKKIPLPEMKRKRKYPFSKMKVGDSFSIIHNKDILSSAAASFKKTNNVKWKFIARRMGNKIRIWRVR